MLALSYNLREREREKRNVGVAKKMLLNHYNVPTFVQYILVTRSQQ